MQHKKQWVMASSGKNYLLQVVKVFCIRESHDKRGGNRVKLGIVDGLLFEISKLLVTVFDEMEYRSAKRASLKAARKPTNVSLKHSQEWNPNGYQFQNEPSERVRDLPITR